MSFFNRFLRRFIKFFGSLRLALGLELLLGFIIAIAAVFFFGWLAGEMLGGDTARFRWFDSRYCSHIRFACFNKSDAISEFSWLDVVFNYVRNHRFRNFLLFKTPTRRRFICNCDNRRDNFARIVKTGVPPRSSRTFFRHNSARVIQFSKRTFARLILFLFHFDSNHHNTHQ